MTLLTLKPFLWGVTKQEMAEQLDRYDPAFNFGVEKGKTSYHMYKRDELIEIAIKYNVDLVSDFRKRSMRADVLKKYNTLFDENGVYVDVPVVRINGATDAATDAAVIGELLKVVTNPTYGDTVYRLMIAEKSDVIVKRLMNG